MKYRYKTKPYHHQVRGIKKLLANGYGGALLFEPRTGKTKTAIDYMSIEAMRGGPKQWLVVCPARVMDVWLEQIHEHCPLRANVLLWDKDERKATIKLPTHTTRYDLTVVVINYDAFATPGVVTRQRYLDRNTGTYKYRRVRSKRKGGRYDVKKKLTPWVLDQPTGCILDESHKIKSPSGKASSMLRRMSPLFDRRVLLTGTVITKAKRPVDVYIQWKFLNPDRVSQWQRSEDFREHFGRFTHANGYPQWLGPKNADELRRLMFKDAVAVKRSECFDLPAPPVKLITVPMERSRKYYDEMARDLVIKLKTGEISEATIKLTQALRLSQITGGVVKVTDPEPGRLVRVGREKLERLEPIFEEAADNDEKVVVMARFKADLAAIARLASDKYKLPTWRLQGGVKPRDSAADIRAFRAHDEAGVYVVQPQAGGLGIDLSTASTLVWFSLTTSWVDYTQATDRLALNPDHQIIYLLAQDSIDELLYASLQLDGNVAKYMTTHPDAVLEGVDLPNLMS